MDWAKREYGRGKESMDWAKRKCKGRVNWVKGQCGLGKGTVWIG